MPIVDELTEAIGKWKTATFLLFFSQDKNYADIEGWSA